MTTPFAFFGFWATTLAVAVAAASIPIIIHLLNRRRYQIVTWAAMRFLLNAQKKNTRKMRLEQLILLAMRVLLVLLLVLAMASIMPWAESLWAQVWPEGAGFIRVRAGRMHKIIVLDGSLSMAARFDGDQSCFEKARKTAVQIVKDSQPGDAFSVLLMKDHPKWIVAGVSANTAEVIKAIQNTKQAHGNADLPTTLKEAAEKLGESGSRFRNRQVYFLTDMQKATWLPGGSIKGEGPGVHVLVQGHLQQLQKQAQTIFVDIHKKNPDNIAVTDLTIGNSLVTTGTKVSVTATIEHFGLVVHNNHIVQLLVGRARSKATDPRYKLNVVREQQIAIKPGQTKPVVLEHKFSKPGTYAVQVRLGGDDLAPDNSRTVIVTVRDTVPVLLVNGQPAVDPFDNATEYLRMALNPVSDGPIPSFLPMRPKVISTAQFTNASEVNLANYDCIFLCNVGQITNGQIRRLETHLRRGGGVVISMGDQTAENLKTYNDLLFQKGKGLLPAKLIGVEQAPPKFYYIPKAEEEAFKQPPLKAFDSHRSTLWNVRFRRYVRAEPHDLKSSRVILSYLPQKLPDAKLPKGQVLPLNDPLLLSWNPPLPVKKGIPVMAQPGKPRQLPTYRGNVILMTSSLNMDWTSWPGSPSFVPMVQELTRFAISGRLREHQSIVGSPLEEFLLRNGTKLSVRLNVPDNSPRSLMTMGAGDVTVFSWPHTDRSGIYRMTVGQDANDYLFAVNVPTTILHQNTIESELTSANKTEMDKAYPKWKYQIVRDLKDVVHRTVAEDGEEVLTQGKLGPEIARLVLYLVVIVLVLEVVLACLFGHFTSVPGSAVQQVRAGGFLPISIAIVAGFGFLVMAVVLFHSVSTGDFLGFLPNSVRAWAESTAGISAPSSGEGRKWEPEFSSYLIDAATDPWLAGFGLLAYAVALIFVYRMEGNNIPVPYKVLLGSLRWLLMFMALGIWLPQLQVNFKRESWPDVIVLIDDSLSMGETDQYQDEEINKTVGTLNDTIKKQLRDQMPDQLKNLRQTIHNKRRQLADGKDELLTNEIGFLEKKLARMETQFDLVDSQSWRPSRLQIAQALLNNDQQKWLQSLLGERQMKVHVYHLDAVGKALKITDAQGKPIAIVEAGQTEPIKKANDAIARLQPYAVESQLGTAVRQVLDHFGGSSVSAVIVLSDGITTSAEDQTGYEKNLGKVAQYAALKGVPLFLVGIGDDHELRDLRLHDLQVIDTVYVNDRVIFEARLTGKGFKNLTVPVILKTRDPDGTETEVDRKNIKIDPNGQPVPVQLKDQPTEPGEKLYIIEVIPPQKTKEDRDEFSNLRLQRTIFVQEAKPIKVLYVEGSARFEYRFLKALLEREHKDAKGDRSLELKVLLVDSDPEFAAQDASAVAEFPFNKQELSQYDAVILGDVDPRSNKLGNQKLTMLADFVREKGGGLLMMGGPLYNPHAYRKTPIADVMPIEPNRAPPAPDAVYTDGYRLELSAVGNLHPIFRLSPNQAENVEIWNRLSPMYWFARGFRLKPAAEVLAVHPKEMSAENAGSGKDRRLPLVVQQFVGAGRCMFFGFEESWLWRFRDDEIYYNKFWIESVRYLSRSRQSHTKLFLDRQTQYRQGEKIKVSVRFPDNTPLPGQIQRTKAGIKTDVKVMVQYQPDEKKKGGGEPDSIELAKVEGSWATYEGLYPATQKGKYRFWLSTPDVSSMQPNKKQPSAEAVVIQPPGELDLLRMNREEMEKAAIVSGGRFYNVATAEQLLSELPSGYRVLLNSEGKPLVLWNQALMFLLAIGILTSEWFLRKRKHLL